MSNRWLGNFRWSRMADRHGPRRLTVVDLGDSEVRLVGVSREGRKLAFTDHATVEIPGHQPAWELSEVFVELARVAHGTPYVSVIFSPEKSHVRLMNFSGNAPRPEGLDTQVRQSLNVGAEYVIRSRITRQAGDQYAVLASAILQQESDLLRTALTAHNLRPVSLVHRGVVVANLAMVAQAKAVGESAGLLFTEVDSSLLVLHVNGELVLVRQIKEGLGVVYDAIRDAYGLDRPMAAKLFSSGSFDLPSGSKAMAGWAHQVELSLDFIERRYGNRINHLYLVGPNLGVNTLCGIFEAGLHRAVEVMPPLADLEAPIQEGRLAEGQKPVSPYLLASSEAHRVLLGGSVHDA